MILLTSVNDSLTLQTNFAGNIDFTVSWADITTSSFTPGANQGNIAVAANTTIVSAPSASTQRQIKLLTVRNRDLTNAQTVCVRKTVSGVSYCMTPDIVLAAGETLQYLDGQGFSVLDPFARPKQAASATIINPPDVKTPYFVQAQDLTQLISELIVEHKITNLILSNAFGQTIDADALRDEVSMYLT